MSSSHIPVTMFYDGGCNLCNTEVSHYMRLDTANRINWIDISKDTSRLVELGINPQSAYERLHVIDNAGTVQQGVHAFVAVWEQLPYYRYLATMVKTTRLTGILESIYGRFARWRFKRRRQNAACNI